MCDGVTCVRDWAGVRQSLGLCGRVGCTGNGEVDEIIWDRGQERLGWVLN